ENHRHQNGDCCDHVVRIEDGQHRKYTAQEIPCRKKIRNQVHGGFSSLPTFPERLTKPCGFHGNSPRMVSPPLTRSPTATFTAVPIGRNVSIRDPNRIKPNRSPSTARSLGEAQHTIRLAINPATCTHNTFAPCTVRIIRAFCSFINVPSGLLPNRNKPD